MKKKLTLDEKIEALLKTFEKICGPGISVDIKFDSEFHKEISEYLEKLKQYDKNSKKVNILLNKLN